MPRARQIMDFDRSRRHAFRSWLSVGVLVLLLAVLGVLQYRWIGEVSLAERERMHAGLEASLRRLSLDFNSEFTAACAALMPDAPQPAEQSRENLYAQRYVLWRESAHHEGIFRRIVLAYPRDRSVVFRNLDLQDGTFSDADLPPPWDEIRDRLSARMVNPMEGPRRPFGPTEDQGAIVEIPRFPMPPAGGPPRGPQRPEPRSRPEMDWLIVELDLDYVREFLLPELLQRHLGGGLREYQVEITAVADPAQVIFRSDTDDSSRIADRADASVRLFELQFEQIFRRPGGFRGREGGRIRGGPPEGPGPSRGRWLLSVRHRAGSLDAVVARARVRNLSVTGGVLLLMLAAVAALVLYTRRAQRLAALEMEFVAGVSHELRTPLSVIRTAAHNLKGGVVTSVTQVQKYGTLIADEADRLTSIVEQVLRFASTKAGRTIGTREVRPVSELVGEAIASSAHLIESSGCELEERVDPDLPPVLVDPIAIRHALQNLLSNAAKYGRDGGWIGVFASASQGDPTFVEIRVVDRGPGIPPGEAGQVWDSFYRGKKALEDQVHGTGLGLNLVKRIIEAHAGTVDLHSEPGKSTEFVIRIPAAPAERQDELAHSAG